MSGGAMRSAAKAAALGGYRSVGPLAGRRAAAGKAPKPASTTVSAAAPAAEGGPSISITSSDKALQEAAPVAAVQRPAWETDDWEFAGWGEEEHGVALDSLHQAPRLVFGPVPTLEEAKEATSDLKDALEIVCFSPGTNEPANEVLHESTHHEASVIPSMPRHVVQTFSLLKGSPEVQNVVASIAADKNVWEAVMKNEQVMEFCRTQISNAVHLEPNVDTEDSVADVNCEASSDEATKSSVFADIVHKVKVKVVKVVSNISSFIQEFLDTSATSSSTSTTTSHDTDKPFFDSPMGTLMALAIAVILLILLNRA